MDYLLLFYENNMSSEIAPPVIREFYFYLLQNCRVCALSAGNSMFYTVWRAQIKEGTNHSYRCRGINIIKEQVREWARDMAGWGGGEEREKETETDRQRKSPFSCVPRGPRRGAAEGPGTAWGEYMAAEAGRYLLFNVLPELTRARYNV